MPFYRSLARPIVNRRLPGGQAGSYLSGADARDGYNDAMPVTITIEKQADATAVVTLQGPLTLGTSLKVADSQINGTIAEGVTKIVMDLTGVDYMDSAGLGLVVFVYGTLSEKSGTLRLCGVAQRLRSLLALTKTDTFLAIDEDRAASLAALATA